MVVQRFARFRTNLGNLRISRGICYVWMTDNNGFLTIYGHRASLLNNNLRYLKFGSYKIHVLLISKFSVYRCHVNIDFLKKISDRRRLTAYSGRLTVSFSYVLSRLVKFVDLQVM